MCFDHAFQMVQCYPGKPHEAVRALKLVQRRTYVVRQVDPEARVAPGRVFARLSGVDQDDLLVRAVLSQTPRGSKAGITRAQYYPVCVRVALQLGMWFAIGQDRTPTVGLVILWQPVDLHSSARLRPVCWLDRRKDQCILGDIGQLGAVRQPETVLRSGF